MNDESMESMTGMPVGKKKTRRGKRARGNTVNTANSPTAHLDNAKKAHAAGDHAEAKRHAFAFVKSLPSSVVPDADPADPNAPPIKLADGGNTMSIPDDEPVSSPPIVPKPGLSGSSKLAGILKARRKELPA